MGVSPKPTERLVKSSSSISLDSACSTSGEETKLLNDSKKEESGEEKEKYPKSIFFIIGNEFCERFTFYGLKGVLMLYLTRQLLYSDDTGIIIIHLFNMLAYFTPVIGAIIADSWLGKFKTILYVSILYSIGNIVLSLGAFPNGLQVMKAVSLTGLLIIALGTGGIKPCVSAFGGDQFKKGQEEHLKRFFSYFYLAINLGSVVSTFLTPILREDVHCLGQKSCYPLAFGVPAMLMILSIVIFISGRSLYTVKPAEGNILVKVSKCICHAIRNKCKNSEKKKSHWLDYAEDKFDKGLIGDIKILFHVLILYLPIPLFWACFDQTASRWTLQAAAMDGTLNGYHIKADQMQLINPLLIIFFIPMFDYVFYPLLAKCHLLVKPLQRVTVGGLLAAVSFILAGLVQSQLETSLPEPPNPGYSELTIINYSPCLIKINGSAYPSIDEFDTVVIKDIPNEEPNSWKFLPENCSVDKSYNFNYDSSLPMQSVMITIQGNNLVVFNSNENKLKSRTGEPLVKIYYNIDLTESTNVSFKLKNLKTDEDFIIPSNASTYGITDYTVVSPGRYEIYLSKNGILYEDTPRIKDDFRSGGSYIVSIYSRTDENKTSVFEMVKANWLSIFLQIPQYIIITAGEIMLSITGLEFSYSQAPTSMKSVLQAAWLLTVAFGNLIVVLIKKLTLFDKVSYELYLFAGLMVVDMIIFAILAYFYKDVSSRNKDQRETSPTNGISNEAYVEETMFNK